MKLRPCIIKGKNALFHKWIEESKIISPSSMIGGHTGGVIKVNLGIVEYTDGTIGLSIPVDIKFIDNKGE